MRGNLDNLTKDDFEKLSSWGHLTEPFAACKDFSPLKMNQRWRTAGQLELFLDLSKTRSGFIKDEDFENYYREVKLPIEKIKWDYMIKRKAWYVTPLGWENIAINGGKVADFGCGDGDTVQRLINFVIEYWNKNNIRDKKLHIVGIDLNKSRVENANTLVNSEDYRISFEFHQGSVVNQKFDYVDNYFDYSIVTAVFEILDDNEFNLALDQITRLTRKGIYTQDILDQLPGGYPRLTLGKSFQERNFYTKVFNLLFTEPFSIHNLQDPRKIYPNLLIQNIWVESD